MAINEAFTFACGMTVKNRLAKPAMTEGLSDEYQRATPELATLYRTWATESGVGMLITGNMQCDKRFLERPRNVVIDLDMGEPDETQLEGLRAYAEAGRQNGTKIIAQIGHAGRQATPLVAKRAIGPSAVQLASTPSAETVEASVEQIERVVEKLAFAAKVVQDCGFDGMEVHAAHGYFISSFLSGIANKREDQFGGSLENKVSVLLNVVRAIREATNPEFCVGVKLNSSDSQKGGFTVEEAGEVAVMLSKEGVDFLELSGGNYESPSHVTGKMDSTIKREAYFLVFAQEIIKKLKESEAQLPIMVTGGFRSSKIMNEAIEQNGIDLIGVGRPLCVDPGCTQELLEGKIEKLPAPEEYLQLPGFYGFGFLQNLKYFNKLRFSASQTTYYTNMFAMGKGTFDKDAKPNLLENQKKLNKIEESNARAIKGYDKNDIYIQDYLKKD